MISARCDNYYSLFNFFLASYRSFLPLRFASSLQGKLQYFTSALVVLKAVPQISQIQSRRLSSAA